MGVGGGGVGGIGVAGGGVGGAGVDSGGEQICDARRLSSWLGSTGTRHEQSTGAEQVQPCKFVSHEPQT